MLKKYSLLILAFALLASFLPGNAYACSHMGPDYSVAAPKGWKVEEVEEAVVRFFPFPAFVRVKR